MKEVNSISEDQSAKVHKMKEGKEKGIKKESSKEVWSPEDHRFITEIPSLVVPAVQVVLMREGKNGPEVFLGHRTAGGFVDQWSFSGGKVDKGESDEQAAMREVLEETGVKLDEKRLSHLRDTSSSTIREKTGMKVRYDYRMKVYTADAGDLSPVNASPDEHSEMRWMSVKDALSMHEKALEKEREMGVSRPADKIPGALSPRAAETLRCIDNKNIENITLSDEDLKYIDKPTESKPVDMKSEGLKEDVVVLNRSEVREGDMKSVRAEIYNGHNYDEIAPALFELTKDQFGPDPKIRQRLELIYNAFLGESIKHNSGTTALLFDGDRLIGYSFAFPSIGQEDTTAHIANTVIHEDYRRKHLVGRLTDTLVSRLEEQGFLYVERECRISNGYADNVERVCGDSIRFKKDIKGTEESGPERYFNIDIKKYLKERNRTSKPLLED